MATKVVTKFCMAQNFMLFEHRSGNEEGKGTEKGEVSGAVRWLGSLSQNLNGHSFLGWGRIRHLEQESKGWCSFPFDSPSVKVPSHPPGSAPLALLPRQCMTTAGVWECCGQCWAGVTGVYSPRCSKVWVAFQSVSQQYMTNKNYCYSITAIRRETTDLTSVAAFTAAEATGAASEAWGDAAIIWFSLLRGSKAADTPVLHCWKAGCLARLDAFSKQNIFTQNRRLSANSTAVSMRASPMKKNS